MNFDKLTDEQLRLVKRLSAWKKFCSKFPEKKFVAQPSLKKEFLSHYSLMLNPTQFQKFECGRQQYMLSIQTSLILFGISVIGSGLAMAVLTEWQHIGRKSIGIASLVSGCYFYAKQRMYYQTISDVYDEFRMSLNEQQINEFENSLRINKTLGLSEAEEADSINNGNPLKSFFQKASGMKTRF